MRSTGGVFFIFLFYFIKIGFGDYTKLINTETHVVVEPLKYMLPRNVTPSDINCKFTIHKESCKNPPMSEFDTILWHTTVCLKWKCNEPKLIIKVNKCWTGSLNNPIFIIGPDGCTVEGSMVKSPLYNLINLNEAQSYGRLSVRLYGKNYIHLGCSISFCHICDKVCIDRSQPICDDHKSDEELKIRRVWSQLPHVLNYCDPVKDEHFLEFLTSSTSRKSQLTIIFISIIYIINNNYF
uniref:ZP domain-containing protein n=1 Tax=Strongyloides venezuelensis TaxID=75913 RepID=A0A0K0G266_STRVS